MQHLLDAIVELANALFEHLQIFHNRRRHTALGMLTPTRCGPRAFHRLRLDLARTTSRSNVVQLGHGLPQTGEDAYHWRPTVHPVDQGEDTSAVRRTNPARRPPSMP
ncbi:hypothetical protein [Pseudonocardia xinjiangensis]|uniref:Integrase catalytic domain-containing protein n=1 Tax=Pseudonocardia xinjiangensis TaxID=75289 RepID=A0ABX1R8V3_9PSEU|nr:hypothetical protein [Pseudonocardia xinjiangensis]NMH75611.1 hypothetical protein [Pseudonocardia xinjiangensis]